jgi:hypothetical protein
MQRGERTGTFVSEASVPKGTLYGAILVFKAETTDRPMRLFSVLPSRRSSCNVEKRDAVRRAFLQPAASSVCSPTQSEATTDKTSRILQEAFDLSS